jgi:hypothetical protein
LRDSDSFFQNEIESDAEHCRMRRDDKAPVRNPLGRPTLSRLRRGGDIMDFTGGAVLWLLGVPLPIILLTALFRHH